MKIAKIEKLGNIDWLQRWAGSYTFISCSYWGPQYYHSLKKQLGINFNHTLFIHRKGTASFYIPNNEFRKLGTFLAKKSSANLSFAKKYCQLLKQNTDLLLPLMNRFEKRIPNLREYQEFYKYFGRHLAYHVFVKKTIDFLSVEVLNKLLPTFKDARLHSEAIYSKSEAFFRSITKLIAKKENCNADLLTCLTQSEFEKYLKNKILPKPTMLKKRFLASALYFEKGRPILLLGKQVAVLEKAMLNAKKQNQSVIKGIVGYPGKVTGRARIVPDPFKVKSFNQGDVLITGMTRPEFMPLIHKSGAIVTEAGGILSHAAITAREFKKPCIVGTQIATKIFKNGDIIEVDANKGIIKLIK